MPEPDAAAPRGRRTLVWVLVTVAVPLVLFSNLSSDDPPAQTETPISPADEYVSDYGGERNVYARILGSSDCQFLQEQFDVAADNNDRADPGSDEHRWTLGYMRMADSQLETSGCY